MASSWVEPLMIGIRVNAPLLSAAESCLGRTAPPAVGPHLYIIGPKSPPPVSTRSATKASRKHLAALRSELLHPIASAKRVPVACASESLKGCAGSSYPIQFQLVAQRPLIAMAR